MKNNKIRVGILSFSDGRKRVHDILAEYIDECALRIKHSLECTGEVEVVLAGEIIYDPDLARTQTKEIVLKNPDAIILNIPVFAFPNFSTIASVLHHIPCLAIAPVNGKLPGLGGLQAAVNMIRQVGLKCEKVWGNIEDEKTLKKVLTFLRASYAATHLKGQVYGLFGGRSIGMGSGAVNPDLWMSEFGVDVEHIDQLEIIRRAEGIDDIKVVKAFDWLQEKVGSIRYNGKKLTEDTLKQQIKCYFATKELINERKLDFIGVKCHYELSEYYVTQCLSAAFFNDPYDWDGAKEPTVFSCEADSDGALSMQIMKLISGKPVFFCDFRHFDETDGVFVFCNCGAISTWYAERSADPETNLRSVNLHPVIDKYAGRGCHVQFIAKEGEVTMGRLTRVLNKYKMSIIKGEVKRFSAEKLKETCPQWPHFYVKVTIDPNDLIDQYESNHIHGIAGDYVEELKKFCELKNIDYEVIA